MGKAHSNAYRQVARFFDMDIEPVMKGICGLGEEAVRSAAQKYGWESGETDWEKFVARDDLDVIDIAAPNHLHAPIAIAAAKAGKIVLCEKPLANTLKETREMVKAVEEAGVLHGLYHNYRKVPAVALAKQIISEGKLGKIFHFRGTYLQDWIVDPNFPLVWRLQKELAGSGAHGDLNAHIIDLARFLVGEFDEVVGHMETFIKKRPILAETDDRLGGKASTELGDVTVDDATIFLARFKEGAIGTFEATRFAPGRKNFNRFEINGSNGSLSFDFERMNELEVMFRDDPANLQGFRNINVTDGPHPYVSNWWPAGHGIGYEHTFIHTVYDAYQAIAKGELPSPNFYDGLKNQAVLEAVEISSNERKWVKVEQS
jgi:predicted dehydrogenase